MNGDTAFESLTEKAKQSVRDMMVRHKDLSGLEVILTQIGWEDSTIKPQYSEVSTSAIAFP